MADLGGNLGELFGGAGGGITKFAMFAIWGVVLLVVVGMCLLFIWYISKKKRNWNMKVEIKIPRSDGKLLTAEWGKGSYDNKRGVVWIKRKKKNSDPMKPFDTSKYLQGKENILTVLQVSVGHYVPILWQSFLEMEDDKTGEEATLGKIIADYSESRSWKNSFEREAKQAYTIMNLLKDYAPLIGVGIILLFNFVGFAILYTKIV